MQMPGEPFKIAVPDAVLADLKERLARTRWPTPAAGPSWDLGTSLPYMQKVVDHWLHRYDWRAWEARLNGFDQRIVSVGGVKIHVLVREGSGPNPMPLVLTHGWPGSAIELIEMIEPLAHPERFGGSVDDAFTVVVPSLPGCGFSGSPKGPVSPREVGAMWGELMTAFGFERYIAHGGDWGAVINAWMGYDRPPGMIGLHVNTVVLQAGDSVEKTPPTPEEAAWLERTVVRQKGETAYQLAHGERPLTLAYGVTDSPAGLAAWILEKFHSWTVGRIEQDPPFDLDHMISNVMFYWLGDAQAVSWMYKYLVDRSGFILPDGGRITIPTGVCLFPKDIAMPPPDSWIKRSYDTIQITRAPAGGHFPGVEFPQVLVDDIRAYRRKLLSL